MSALHPYRTNISPVSDVTARPLWDELSNWTGLSDIAISTEYLPPKKASKLNRYALKNYASYAFGAAGMSIDNDDRMTQLAVRE